MQGHVVPWFDRNEWITVYNNLYGVNCNLVTKREALSILTVWKARCPFLPSSIESTLGLLQVHLEDANLETTKDNLHHVLQLAYSSALMRLVNHLLDSKAAKGATLYRAAKEVGLPDWIIDLRHDAAHSNALATLELLREATAICFEWLHNHYWKKHKDIITDYRVGRKIVSVDDDKIVTLANLSTSLSICAHPQCKIKGLTDVPQEDLQEVMIEAAKDLFGDVIDLFDSKTLYINSLINLLNTQAKKWLQTDQAETTLITTLLSEDLFLSLKLVQELGGKEFYKNNSLSRHYMRSLEVLLEFLHTNDLMLKFILELIAITQSEDKKHHTRKLAALWIKEIVRALNRSKLFLEKYNSVKTDNIFKKSHIKTLFLQWFPNEEKRGIILNLQKPIPQEITDRNFVYNLVSVYNPYLSYYVRDIFNLVRPIEPKSNVDMICNLVNIMCGVKSTVEGEQLVNDKSFTVRDLELVFKDLSDHQRGDSTKHLLQDCVDMESSSIEMESSESHIWGVATDTVNWSTCPIGLLPWQQSSILENMEE